MALCLVFEIFFCFCWYICSIMSYVFFLYIWKEPFHCFRNLLLDIKYKSFVSDFKTSGNTILSWCIYHVFFVCTRTIIVVRSRMAQFKLMFCQRFHNVKSSLDIYFLALHQWNLVFKTYCLSGYFFFFFCSHFCLFVPHKKNVSGRKKFKSSEKIAFFAIFVNLRA